MVAIDNRNPRTKWRPKTQYYNYNYGIGMNYYQPMIDFIDEKTKGRRVPTPHLPWTDELGLSQFDPNRLRSYNDHELAKLTDKTEKSAKIRLGHASSSFLLRESVGAARITTKIQQEERKKNKVIKEIKKLKNRMRDDCDYDPQRDREVERELRAQQKYLRGKSAKGIEQQLLATSRRTVAENIDYDLKVAQMSHSIASSRCLTHVKMMDERMTSQLEESVRQPLETLSLELQGFDRRATHNFIDQRYNKKLFN